MKLDLGCGFRKRDPQACGVDVVSTPATDVICDLGTYPWPFTDNSIDHFLCYHVIEHVPDIIGFMREVHRIGREGAIFEGEVPHFLSSYAYTDPTHIHFLGLRAFDMFCLPETVKQHRSILRRAVNRLLGVQHEFGTFHAGGLFRKRLICLRLPGLYRLVGLNWLINKFPEAYEVQGVLRGPGNIYFELEVQK